MKLAGDEQEIFRQERQTAQLLFLAPKLFVQRQQNPLRGVRSWVIPHLRTPQVPPSRLPAPRFPHVF